MISHQQALKGHAGVNEIRSYLQYYSGEKTDLDHFSYNIALCNVVLMSYCSLPLTYSVQLWTEEFKLLCKILHVWLKNIVKVQIHHTQAHCYLFEKKKIIILILTWGGCHCTSLMMSSSKRRESADAEMLQWWKYQFHIEICKAQCTTCQKINWINLQISQSR